jgi:hypothetical protein
LDPGGARGTRLKIARLIGDCSGVAFEGGYMIMRFVIAVGVATLLAGSAAAQDYCAQVKQAVATYGYASARKHALETYGKDAVAYGDKCLRGSRTGKQRTARRVKT